MIEDNAYKRGHEQVTRLRAEGMSFDIAQAIKAGWVLFRAAWWPHVAYSLLLLAAVAAVLLMFGVVVYSGFWLAYLIIPLVFLILVLGFFSPSLGMGYVWGAHLTALNQQPDAIAFLAPARRSGRFFAAYVLVYILVSLTNIPMMAVSLANYYYIIFKGDYGAVREYSPVLSIAMLVSLIPQVYLGVCYVYTPFFILFHRFGVWEAMEASRRTVHRSWFQMFGFCVVLYLLNVAGALCLLVGLLVTVPVTAAALYTAYAQDMHLQEAYFDEIDLIGQDD